MAKNPYDPYFTPEDINDPFPPAWIYGNQPSMDAVTAWNLRHLKLPPKGGFEDAPSTAKDTRDAIAQALMSQVVRSGDVLPPYLPGGMQGVTDLGSRQQEEQQQEQEQEQTQQTPAPPPTQTPQQAPPQEAPDKGYVGSKSSPDDIDTTAPTVSLAEAVSPDPMGINQAMTSVANAYADTHAPTTPAPVADPNAVDVNDIGDLGPTATTNVAPNPQGITPHGAPLGPAPSTVNPAAPLGPTGTPAPPSVLGPPSHKGMLGVESPLTAPVPTQQEKEDAKAELGRALQSLFAPPAPEKSPVQEKAEKALEDVTSPKADPLQQAIDAVVAAEHEDPQSAPDQANTLGLTATPQAAPVSAIAHMSEMAQEAMTHGIDQGQLAQVMENLTSPFNQTAPLMTMEAITSQLGKQQAPQEKAEKAEKAEKSDVDIASMVDAIVNSVLGITTAKADPLSSLADAYEQTTQAPMSPMQGINTAVAPQGMPADATPAGYTGFDVGLSPAAQAQADAAVAAALGGSGIGFGDAGSLGGGAPGMGDAGTVGASLGGGGYGPGEGPGGYGGVTGQGFGAPGGGGYGSATVGTPGQGFSDGFGAGATGVTGVTGDGSVAGASGAIGSAAAAAAAAAAAEGDTGGTQGGSEGGVGVGEGGGIGSY